MAASDARRVLICLDGSNESDNAFEWYMKNLKQENDYVFGLTIPEYSFKGITVGPLADPQALSNQFQEQLKVTEKLCSDYTARLRSKSVKGQVDAHSDAGKVGEIIVDQAEKLNVEMIVMGTRGLSKVKKMFLGSVSNYVLHHACVPVTVIPPPKKDCSQASS